MAPSHLYEAFWSGAFYFNARNMDWTALPNGAGVYLAMVVGVALVAVALSCRCRPPRFVPLDRSARRFVLLEDGLEPSILL